MSLDLEPVAWRDKDLCILHEDERETPVATLERMGWEPLFTKDQLIAAQVKVLREAADLLENYYGQGGAGMVRRMADELEMKR